MEWWTDFQTKPLETICKNNFPYLIEIQTVAKLSKAIEQIQAAYQNLDNNERIAQDYRIILELCDRFASNGGNCRLA